MALEWPVFEENLIRLQIRKATSVPVARVLLGLVLLAPKCPKHAPKARIPPMTNILVIRAEGVKGVTTFGTDLAENGLKLTVMQNIEEKSN
jgi:hypothetical protein